MEFEIWHLWLIAGIIMIIIELFTPVFIFASIGIGCFFAAIASFLGAGFVVQVLTLSAITGISFILVRPMLKHLAKNRASIKTNAAGMIGKKGKVIIEIDNLTDMGQVEIDGVIWKAQATGNSIISAGTKIEVCVIDSIILTVAPVHNSSEIEKSTQKDLHTQAQTNNSFSQIKTKVGNKTQLIDLTNIYCIYTENKICFAINNEGKSFLLDDSLDRIEKGLPHEHFFRANRQYIIHRNLIREFAPENNGKILIQLKEIDRIPETLIVSRLKASTFRKWIRITTDVK